MKKIDLSNKKTNLIVSSVIIFIVLVIGIYTSITFISFYRYRAKFYIDANVTEIEKLSKYSPSIAGTINDVDIYIKNGYNNTVALVKEDASSLDELKAKGICASQEQWSIADPQALTLASTDVTFVANDQEAYHSLVDGNCGAAIMSFFNAYQYTIIDPSLKISEVEVERVPSMLILGGTHPNEPSGQLASVVYLENLYVSRGKFYIITELNRSGYSYSQPQEGQVMYYSIDVLDASGNKIGERKFKYGSRLTNVVNQWPVPDVYTHQSGQQLSANEVRNLNRSYPGSINGSYTERISYGITQCILQNDITILIDLHEASPEYMTNNACVFHEDVSTFASKTHNRIKKKYTNIKFDVSSPDLHGLTHRELGDYTNAYCFLFETSCAAIGRIHGKVTEGLVTYNEPDKFYEYLHALDVEGEAQDPEFVRYLEAYPVSLDERVARHVTEVSCVIDAFNTIKKERTAYSATKLDESLWHNEATAYVGQFVISGIPGYEEVLNNTVGMYLKNVD